jgi:hypothetical protein
MGPDPWRDQSLFLFPVSEEEICTSSAPRLLKRANLLLSSICCLVLAKDACARIITLCVPAFATANSRRCILPQRLLAMAPIWLLKRNLEAG